MDVCFFCLLFVGLFVLYNKFHCSFLSVFNLNSIVSLFFFQTFCKENIYKSYFPLIILLNLIKNYLKSAKGKEMETK